MTSASRTSGATVAITSASSRPRKMPTVANITAPSATSARMLSSVWETIVPSTTGKRSRMRPSRRARISAREGSPSRAGIVADISTPIIVAARGVAPAHADARQRGAQDRVPGLGAQQHRGAHQRERDQHPDRRRRQQRAADRLEPDPVERERGQADAGERSAERPAPRRARRARGGGALAGASFGSSEGSRRGRTRGPGSAGRGRRCGPAARGAGRGLRLGERLLVDLRHLGGHLRPGEALGALARGAGHALAPLGVEREVAQGLAELDGVAGRHQQAVLALAHDVAVAGDARGDHRRRRRERLGQHHAEALAAEGRRAEQVGRAEQAPLLLLGDAAGDLDALGVEQQRLDLLARWRRRP